MKHSIRRRRALRPRPNRHQVNQEIRRARRLQELFRIEQALELRRPEPDVAHLRHIQDQLAALEDNVISLEAC
jgi:CHAD domain-containing protein